MNGNGVQAPGNGLELSVPGGGSIKASGREVVIVILVVVIGLLIYRGFDATASQHASLANSFDRLACIFSLPESDRLAALQSGDPCRFALSVRRLGDRR